MIKENPRIQFKDGKLYVILFRKWTGWISRFSECKICVALVEFGLTIGFLPFLYKHFSDTTELKDYLSGASNEAHTVRGYVFLGIFVGKFYYYNDELL
jgi:hypothetical protein